MLLTQVNSPLLQAPEGIKLGDGFKIDNERLEDDSFSISSIRIRNNCSIEIEFLTARDVVGNIVRYATRLDDNPPEEKEHASCIKNYYMDILSKHGIPKAAIAVDPACLTYGITIQYIFTVSFLVEPLKSYELNPTSSGFMEVNSEKLNVKISKPFLIMVGQDGIDESRQTDADYIVQLGRDLAWALPWQYHWAIESASVFYEEYPEDDPHLLFDFRFFDRKNSLWRKGLENHNQHPVFWPEMTLRPILRHGV